MELIRIEDCGYIVTKKIQDKIICMLIDAETEEYKSGSMDDICCICMKKHRVKNVIELECCGKEFGKECLVKHIKTSMTRPDGTFNIHKSVACPLCRKDVIFKKFWYPYPIFPKYKLSDYNACVENICWTRDIFRYDKDGKRRPGY
jgi:hypothetical protein